MERRLAAILAADVVCNSRLIREDEASPDLLEREQYWMDRLKCRMIFECSNFPCSLCQAPFLSSQKTASSFGMMMGLLSDAMEKDSLFKKWF